MDVVLHPPRLPRRNTAAHKASVGRVLVAGGSVGMAGAPALAGLGALRAGAGLVNVAVPSTVQPTVAAYRPEWTTTALGPDTATALGMRGAEQLEERAPHWDALVLGPGLGRNALTQAAVLRLVASVNTTLVLDADGLYAVIGQLDVVASRTGASILTPHEGEAARLLGCPSDEVRANRQRAATQIASQTNAVVILKGHQTLVCAGERIYVNQSGNPLLATGGSGDVLAGVCAALVASGIDAFDAACAAVYVHGLAADHLARRDGIDRGMLASDVAHALPSALGTMLEDAPAAERQR